MMSAIPVARRVASAVADCKLEELAAAMAKDRDALPSNAGSMRMAMKRATFTFKRALSWADT